MATANPIEPEPVEDNFELELIRVREKIKSKFLELIDYLKERKSALLRELDTILTCYNSYKREFTKLSEKKIALEKLKIFHQNELLSSPIKSVHDNFISQLNTELESIEMPKQPKMVSFTCDNNELLDEVNKLGKLVERVRTGIDYTSKIQPLVTVCKKGNGNEQLNWPHFVTVDNKTGNIYIADNWNNCVKVFDSNAKYLFKLGNSKGEGKMFCPRRLLICGSRILISHSYCILNYNLDGKFISSIGKHGKEELEFNYPYGLAINEFNDDIYICDCGNNRVQILSKDFQFKSQFGSFTHPRDVKLSKEYIYVLDVSNPCIHIFNHNHILQKSIISRGQGNQVIIPFSFFIDNSNYILIPDYSSNSISIFNPEFQSIHNIPVSEYPTAVTVDNHDRVIVVCYHTGNCLQIF